MKQYEISPTRMGLVYSAYLLVYTICMIPGGLFIDRAEAMKFARLENGNHPQAVIMVPGILELDMSGERAAGGEATTGRAGADAQHALARAA